MTIRPAVEADRGALLRMASRFLSADGPYGTRFTVDPERMSALVDQMLSRSHTVTLVAESDRGVDGMFGMFTFMHPITGECVAAELCWWMEPEARGTRAALQLLRAGEAWASQSGATVIEMIAPDERVAGLYDRLGYERTDVHYRKSL